MTNQPLGNVDAAGQTGEHSEVVRVLVVGQTPPPIHGQSLMIQYLLEGVGDDIELHHVRMAFSTDLQQVGRFGMGKVVHLLSVVFAIWGAWWRWRPAILYYPPSGPNRVPFYRDVVLLLCTRWLFRHTVFHFHAAGLSELFPRLHPVERWLGKLAYFAPSAAIRLSPVAVDDPQFIRAQRNLIIPNGVPDQTDLLNQSRSAAEAVHRANGHGSAPLRIVYLGTVCESKGVSDLLRACTELKARGVLWQLKIIGGVQRPEYLEELEQYIRQQGLEARVEFTGQLVGQAKARTCAEADVFCFPSFYESEGFPCVLLEAMSLSLPLVSTRWRGIPAIIDEGQNGFLVEIHQPGQIADRLQQLAESADLRKRLGQSARHKFQREYTLATYRGRLANLFRELGRPA